MHLTSGIFFLSQFLSVVGNPIPSQATSSTKEFSDTLSILVHTAAGLLEFGNGITQEVLLLGDEIQKVQDGKTGPV